MSLLFILSSTAEGEFHVSTEEIVLHLKVDVCARMLLYLHAIDEETYSMATHPHP